MHKTTILTIGDSVDFDSFKKFNREKRFISKQGFDYAAMDYDALIKTPSIEVSTPKVMVVTFFPFKYWDKHIECKRYKGLYGNLLFLKKFKKFCSQVIRRVEDLLPGKETEFINDPRLTAMYRDKEAVFRKLARGRVKVPQRIKTRSVPKIKKLLDQGKEIYVKPRCGSMGKGITFLSKDNWQTNFTVRGGKIIQRCSDYGWKFKEVTGNARFLQSLLNGDFVFEEAVVPFCLNHKKIDLRVYACRDKVMYIYPRENNKTSVTTNISQGGKGRPSILKKIPRSIQNKIIKQVLRTMRVLDLDFAGIDVIPDEDLRSVYVIDVNMFPGFPKRRTHNLARDIIRELKKKR